MVKGRISWMYDTIFILIDDVMRATRRSGVFDIDFQGYNPLHVSQCPQALHYILPLFILRPAASFSI